jgi:hypothetical protein
VSVLTEINALAGLASDTPYGTPDDDESQLELARPAMLLLKFGVTAEAPDHAGVAGTTGSIGT